MKLTVTSTNHRIRATPERKIVVKTTTKAEAIGSSPVNVDDYDPDELIIEMLEHLDPVRPDDLATWRRMGHQTTANPKLDGTPVYLELANYERALIGRAERHHFESALMARAAAVAVTGSEYGNSSDLRLEELMNLLFPEGPQV